VAENEERKTFRFLTSDEFNRLTQHERVDYMTRAIAELKRRAATSDRIRTHCPEIVPCHASRVAGF
jgi:hypothetical protein